MVNKKLSKKICAAFFTSNSRGATDYEVGQKE
jgi:hypothetical protein